MPTFPVLTETIHTGAYLVSEAHGFFSRDTIAMSNAVEALSGTVLAKAGVPSAETATASVNAGNTGNGTLTMDPTAPIAPTAIDGIYTIELLTPTTFNVLDPKGKIAGKGTVGQTYAGAIKFTLAAGATAFVAGDDFTVTVLRPDGVGDAWAPLDAGFAGEIGGVLFTHVRAFPVGGTAGIVQAVAHVRQCEVRASDLTWPAGATAAQIAEGTLALKRLGIILR